MIEDNDSRNGRGVPFRQWLKSMVGTDNALTLLGNPPAQLDDMVRSYREGSYSSQLTGRTRTIEFRPTGSPSKITLVSDRSITVSVSKVLPGNNVEVACYSESSEQRAQARQHSRDS